MDFSDDRKFKGFEFKNVGTFSPFKGLNSQQLKRFEEGESKILKDFHFKKIGTLRHTLNEKFDHVVSLEGENLTMIRIVRTTKRIHLDNELYKLNEATLIHERRVVAKCKHRFFPKLRRTILTEDHLVYLMEHHDRKKELVVLLDGKAVKLDPTMLKEVLISVISCLKYLSDNNCLPAAILPDEFFLDENGKLI